MRFKEAKGVSCVLEHLPIYSRLDRRIYRLNTAKSKLMKRSRFKLAKIHRPIDKDSEQIV
jgi:hypothetical protein